MVTATTKSGTGKPITGQNNCQQKRNMDNEHSPQHLEAGKRVDNVSHANLDNRNGGSFNAQGVDYMVVNQKAKENKDIKSTSGRQEMSQSCRLLREPKTVQVMKVHVYEMINN